MLKDLIKLADYLDTRDLKNKSDKIDTLIANAINLADQTWVEEIDPNETPSLSEQRVSRSPLGQDFGEIRKVELSSGAILDLEKHPLGKTILSLIKNVFSLADSETNSDITESSGYLSAEMIQEFLNQAFRYDENLQKYPTWKAVLEPITPIQMKNILNQAMKTYNTIYKSSGDVDLSEVINSVDGLYQNYADLYLDRYGNSEVKYKTYNGETPDQANYLDIPELSEYQREELWESEDYRLQGSGTNSWLDQIERSDNPSDSAERKRKQTDEIKKEFPPEWHDLLLDK